MPTGADLIVAALLDAGVHTLFGVPGGGGNLDLIAASGRAGLPFVLTSTETAAALAAMAQAEITGRPGACLTTLGPGAASVVNGVACAFLDRSPLIVFTDSYPDGARARFEHQRLDHAALMAPITKASVTLTEENIPDALLSALHTAAAGRPGPVHVDCPGAAASTGLESVRTRTVKAANPISSEASPSGEIGGGEQWLARARRPLLLCGLGARRRQDAAAIRALCEQCHMPAMVTYKAKGIVPDTHPWFAGVLTNAAIEQPILDQSDLLIGMGLDPVELLPRTWTRATPIINYGPWPVENQHLPFAAQIVGDIAACAEYLAARQPVSAWRPEDLGDRIAEQRRRIMVAGDGLTAQLVVERSAKRLGPLAGRVTVDAGAHMLPATMLWPICQPNQMLISNGLSTMGFAVPAAIGAALLDRERPVVALTGDGGLLMCLGELLTAVRERLHLIVIVFSDASLSLIEVKQQARQFQPAGVALGAIDWPGLAESFGMTAWAAATEAELERGLEEALACDSAALIEARIDRSNYGATIRAVRG